MTQSTPDDVKNRYLSVRHAVQRAARDAGRAEADVTLVVVSKTFGPEDIDSGMWILSVAAPSNVLPTQSS